jgi:hypothetical protein
MKNNIVLGAFLGLCLISTTALADNIVVVPGGFSGTEANSSDNAPLGASEQHFQQVFSSAVLTNLVAGDLINGIAFRVDGSESSLPAQTVTTYNIGMSSSPNAPGSLSSTFADNRGADYLSVRSGPLTINPGDFSGGSSPNTFGWITFSTPYLYTGGNLLVEIAYQGFSIGRDADAEYPYDSTLAQTAFGTGFSSTTADAGLYPEALVMGFSVETVPAVPEPSASAMFLVGALFIGVQVRRKSRTA